MDPTKPRLPEDEAQRLAEICDEIKSFLPDKVRAYGNAHGLQRGLWQTLLEQYRVGDEYHIPVALMDHVPRLTRVFDRACRLVSNPAQDLHGEDPWKDLAGDAIAGISMPRTPPSPGNFAQEGEERCGAVGPRGQSCERKPGHDDHHGRYHPGLGGETWYGDHSERVTVKEAGNAD